ncbi:hypothetical protein FOVG_07521 [Fusarium oxysporum f. sp. pisi HDV247]|uniref:Uncharacterized protein n=1 Tax=Fusarium oxysporum f. sp. pisi HDV247 TaxID=1080344 RepID=W9PAV2_FUSOX|nr:hypothetical protein FOVG_07521 [Fusarium oxysporum f. sp. pisi HDV247]
MTPHISYFGDDAQLPLSKLAPVEPCLEQATLPYRSDSISLLFQPNLQILVTLSTQPRRRIDNSMNPHPSSSPVEPPIQA